MLSCNKVKKRHYLDEIVPFYIEIKIIKRLANKIHMEQ